MTLWCRRVKRDVVSYQSLSSRIRVKMIFLQKILFLCFFALISCELRESLTASEEEEVVCTMNITQQSINPQMETFFTNLQAKELKLIKSADDRESFHRICKRIQIKLVAFQIKIVQELLPCLRNTTVAEYEAYIKITNKLSTFICNLDERRLKILGRRENYDEIMSRGEELLNCAINPPKDNEFNFTMEFCAFNETKLFDCSLDIFGVDNVGPRTLIKTVWKFLHSLINCKESKAKSRAKVDAKFIANYFNHLLIPAIQTILRDNYLFGDPITEENLNARFS